MIRNFIAFVPERYKEHYRRIIEKSKEFQQFYILLYLGKRRSYDLVDGKQYKKPRLLPPPQQPITSSNTSPIIPVTPNNQQDPKIEQSNISQTEAQNSDFQKLCPICKEVYKEPAAGLCGHVACFECWKQWLKIRLECPLCKHRVREKNLRKIFL